MAAVEDAEQWFVAHGLPYFVDGLRAEGVLDGPRVGPDLDAVISPGVDPGTGDLAFPPC